MDLDADLRRIREFMKRAEPMVAEWEEYKKDEARRQAERAKWQNTENPGAQDHQGELPNPLADPGAAPRPMSKRAMLLAERAKGIR